jgi:hypothetical protein
MKRGRSGGTPTSGTTSTNVIIRRHVSVSPRLAATHSSVQSNRRNFVGVVTVRQRPTSIRGALCCRANANASRISRLGKPKNASGGVLVVAPSSGAWLFPSTGVCHRQKIKKRRSILTFLFDRQCPECNRSDGANVVMEARNDDLCALSREDFQNAWAAEAQDYMGTG